MKRRSFIKTTTFTSIPLLLKGIPVVASSDLLSQSLEKMAVSALNCDRILVIIQQNGGNDGLNTVFPLDKWSNLVNARSNILMDQKQVLSLSENLLTGLHPAMSGIVPRAFVSPPISDDKVGRVSFCQVGP